MAQVEFVAQTPAIVVYYHTMATRSRTARPTARRRPTRRATHRRTVRPSRSIDPVVLKIAEKIAQEYQPEKIILFGSHAWGTPGPESDVDLLVVKESLKPRFERGIELREKLYPPATAMDLLVYTPAELRDSIQRRRNLFLEDVVKNGRILYDAHAVRR